MAPALTNMSFEYNFTSHTNKDNESQDQVASESYSIDVNQITPPTFRFGQFGQAPLPSDDWNFSSSTDSVNREIAAIEDDDSFLAEPSISVGQFDSTFGFSVPEHEEHEEQEQHEQHQDHQEEPPSPHSTSSNRSIPRLIEETLEEPVYLEEPAPHSVEDLLKATIDGDATAVFKDSWESFSPEDAEAAEKEFDQGKVEFVAPLPHETVPVEQKPVSEIISAIESLDGPINEDKDISLGLPDDPLSEVEELETVVAKPKSPAKAQVKSKKSVAEKVKPVKRVEVAESPVKAKRARPVVNEEKIAVVVSSGRPVRERKTVQRLADSQPVKAPTEKIISIPMGSGTKLGEIEAIDQSLTRKLGSDKSIILLHRVLFDRPGESRQRKANIRSFCGVQGAPANIFEAKLQKYTLPELKPLTELLALSGTIDKTSLVAKISAFLVEPSLDKTFRSVEKKKGKKAVVLAPSKRTAPSRTGIVRKVAPVPRKPKAPKEAPKSKYLTPETIDSDVDSDVEREVLSELEKENILHGGGPPRQTPTNNQMTRAELKLWIKLFLFRFLLACCTFSASHPDELWQFHEPAHVKVFQRGHLTWDWRARIRSFIFPLPLILFFYIAKGFGVLGFPGVEDFIVQGSPLVIKAFWCSLTDLFTYKLSQKYFGPLSGKWALLFTLASPAQADIGNRALSNGLETALCSVTAYIWPTTRREWSRSKLSLALIVLGFACLVRVSAIQMFLPPALFLFLYAPSPVEVIFTALPMVLFIVLFGIAVDSALYGEFTVSWWNFFQWNVVRNVSSHFGVESVFFYFESIKSSLIGSTILPFTLYGLFRAFKSFKCTFPFFLFVLPYFVFSSIQPHKEHRFILPILPLLLAYSAHGGQQIELWLHKRNRFIKLSCQLILIGIVWFNSWNILKATSLQAVGSWNAIQDLRAKVSKTINQNSVDGGIFLLANCHNFPNYGVFHLNYPLTFIPCAPPFAIQFFKNDPGFNFQLDLSMYYHSGMMRETIEHFSKNNPSKLPAKYIVAIGYTFLNNRDLLKELGYTECARHTSYILDSFHGRESSINDVYIACHHSVQ